MKSASGLTAWTCWLSRRAPSWTARSSTPSIAAIWNRACICSWGTAEPTDATCAEALAAPASSRLPVMTNVWALTVCNLMSH